MIVLLMKYKYAPSKSRDWREHVSNNCAPYEMEIRTGCGGNKSAMTVLLMKWEYAHPDQKWREHVSHGCAAYEMEIRAF